MMPGILVRWLILTIAIMAASALLDGIEVRGFLSALLAAAVVGFLNATFRPLLIVLTLPINLVTLGLFTFVINAVLLMMASGLIGGFHVRGFWWAVLGSLVISLVSALMNSLVSDRGRVEIIELRKNGTDHWE